VLPVLPAVLLAQQVSQEQPVRQDLRVILEIQVVQQVLRVFKAQQEQLDLKVQPEHLVYKV
jgi:hypothetical protein